VKNERKKIVRVKTGRSVIYERKMQCTTKSGPHESHSWKGHPY